MLDLQEIAVAFLKMVTAELDPHSSTKGVIEPINSGAILFTPAHIQFAKYGRGPGKQPPLDPIIEWVKREGITFDGLDERGTAWAIAKGIAKNGTLNYTPNAPDAMQEAIGKYYDEYLGELQASMTVQIEEQTKTIVYLPESTYTF